MRRSTRLAQKQEAKLENNVQDDEPKAKNDRSFHKTTHIATIDNGTMMEVLKFMTYCQLAKNSLISKTFRNLILTYRHKLALFHADIIIMGEPFLPNGSSIVSVFDKVLSPEEYDEWVTHNQYSKQVPFESEIAGKPKAEDGIKMYQLSVLADNKDKWPLFQHFVRLLTDPFIYINYVELNSQSFVLNLLAKVFNPDRGRLNCEELRFCLVGDNQKFITWVKNNVRCDKFHINFKSTKSDLNYDKELLDIFVTGSQCTSSIVVRHYDLSKVVINFVQKFLELKNCDDGLAVEYIENNVADLDIKELKLNYAECITREGESEDYDNVTSTTFVFINNDIEKKLELTASFSNDADQNPDDANNTELLLEIKHL